MKRKKIKILYLCSELTPLAKVGGLADVAGALPKSLKKLGLDIRVLMPYYQIIEEQKIKAKKVISHLIVPFGQEHYVATVFKSYLPNSTVPLYLLHHHQYLSTSPVYSSNRDRFMFFSQAIIEFLKLSFFSPDIIHINDWHVSAVPLLIKKDKILKQRKYKTILTVHNLAMKGKIAYSKTRLWHPSLYEPSRKRVYNILQQGIAHSNLINTVSPQYAKEILTKEYGTSLLPFLLKNRRKLNGILNGIDPELFCPQNDNYLKKKYSWRTINDKKINKRFLQKKAKLPERDDVPVFSLVSRITAQKGIDLIMQIIPKLAELNAQFIFTGAGKKHLEDALKKAVEKFPDKFYFYNKFDAAFGQYVYGGADFFLMPSKFEPCGLGQMIAMAYGTIPIARATGGLKDTVQNNKTGFVFTKYNASELLNTIIKAVIVYQDKKTWAGVVKNAMHQDFSWHNSAKQYLALYKKLLKK